MNAYYSACLALPECLFANKVTAFLKSWNNRFSLSNYRVIIGYYSVC